MGDTPERGVQPGLSQPAPPPRGVGAAHPWQMGEHPKRPQLAGCRAPTPAELAGLWLDPGIYGWVITGDFVDVCCLVVAQTFTNNFTANEFIVYNILIPLTKFVFLGGCPHRLSWCMSHIANYYGFRKWPQHGRKCAYRQFWILKKGT